MADRINLGEPLLDQSALCSLLKTSRMGLWRRRQEPDFPRPVRIGSRLRWLPDQLRQYLTDKTQS